MQLACNHRSVACAHRRVYGNSIFRHYRTQNFITHHYILALCKKPQHSKDFYRLYFRIDIFHRNIIPLHRKKNCTDLFAIPQYPFVL